MVLIVYILKRFALLFLVLVLVTASGYAQQTTPIPDSLQKNAADTTHRVLDSDKIIKDLKAYSKRKTIVGRLIKAVFRFDRKPEPAAVNPQILNYQFPQHHYKIVRRIYIKSLDAFGYSINDTTRLPANFLEKAGNSLHVKTHQGRIRNKLLFKPGEPLEPLDLTESERLLRQTDYILDARVTVNEKTSTADSVDIVVITKDVFSISAGGSYSAGKSSGRIVLRDINFMGSGHQIRNSYRFGLDSIQQSYEYTGSYRVENIYKTFISSELIYRDEVNYKQKGASLQRDFFAINTKYAGAIALNWYTLPTYVRLTDSTGQRQNISFSTQDYWLSKSFRFKSYNLGQENRGRIITSGRVIITRYPTPPTDEYQSNTFYLAGIGYTYRKYYKDRYLFGFGRTEDIPAGNLLALTYGLEHGNNYNRRYIDIKAGFGKYQRNFGYLNFTSEFNTFIRDKKWEQGELATEILYFTRLYNINTWRMRHFVWNRTSYGLNRKYGENVLNINKYEGVRGFNSPERGTRKFVLNYENNLYTPLSFVGFRFAIVAFADIAWLSTGNSSNPFRNTPLQGYGIGFRFLNEYTTFNTIQISLGFYPQGPTSFKTYPSTRPYYEFNDFTYSRPITAVFGDGIYR
ncbi:BamA/TamA family outer membrane protein [Adhaeribacter radiodurans]|uniref:BamA/TamA family outer membrane protein n=1 Tax=Adhaeribacter radiodurans TaxID=2745197 RepID=A0A7L7LB01_9BACT|nr:hypothetical protein [Adhaeribacter radiodurans]QMU30000.1 hypothetical protein HUW48_19075 [Adhaeribacter radiodurans]